MRKQDWPKFEEFYKVKVVYGYAGIYADGFYTDIWRYYYFYVRNGVPYSMFRNPKINHIRITP